MRVVQQGSAAQVSVRYDSARDFFDAAREAARRAERIRRELAALEADMESLGGGGFEPRIRSTPDPDAIGRKVATTIERRESKEREQDGCYRLIDAACEVLYGPDNRSGLYALVGWPADAIYHHYLALRTWEDTAGIMGYSTQHVKRMCYAAIEYADSNGPMWTAAGIGIAES